MFGSESPVPFSIVVDGKNWLRYQCGKYSISRSVIRSPYPKYMGAVVLVLEDTSTLSKRGVDRDGAMVRAMVASAVVTSFSCRRYRRGSMGCKSVATN